MTRTSTYSTSSGNPTRRFIHKNDSADAECRQEHRQAVPPPPASPLSQRLAGGEGRDQAISGMEPPRPAVFRPAPASERVPTLPGVGCLWAGVLASARGEVRRFAPPQECAS